MTRGHDLNCLDDIVTKLKLANIRTCLHIINGLPDETSDMMIQTAKHVAKLKVDGIKIHMLHIIKDAVLANMYLNKPFELLSKEAYVSIVIKENLIAPLWTLRKTSVLNDIAKEMVNQDTYQGKYHETN